jgi:hypothetical protein
MPRRTHCVQGLHDAVHKTLNRSWRMLQVYALIGGPEFLLAKLSFASSIAEQPCRRVDEWYSKNVSIDASDEYLGANVKMRLCVPDMPEALAIKSRAVDGLFLMADVTSRDQWESAKSTVARLASRSASLAIVMVGVKLLVRKKEREVSSLDIEGWAKKLGVGSLEVDLTTGEHARAAALVMIKRVRELRDKGALPSKRRLPQIHFSALSKGAFHRQRRDMVKQLRSSEVAEPRPGSADRGIGPSISATNLLNSSGGVGK